MSAYESDLTLVETKAILATMLRLTPDDIEDWLIIAKRPCGNCGRQFCCDGDIATISSRAGVLPDGSVWHEPAFELHLVAKLTDSLARTWADS